MSKKPSTAIQIAAFILLAGGLLSLMAALIKLTVLSTANAPADIRLTVEKITNMLTIVWSSLSVLSGWYLIKMKRWSYILGLVLMVIAIGGNIFVLSQVGTTSWLAFSLSVAILILLIVGKKDFKKS